MRSRLFRLVLMAASLAAGDGFAQGAPPVDGHAGAVFAANDATDERLDRLDAEIRELRQRLAEAESRPAIGTASAQVLVPPAPAAEGHVMAAGRVPPPVFDPHVPGGTSQTPVSYPTFRVTGMFQLDTAFFDQDELNRATVGDIDDGTGFRRVRLGVTGNVTEDTTYMFEFDFAQAAQRFADLWLDFSDVPYVGGLRIGRFRQPFGMSEITSIRALPFLERPPLFAFSPFRQTGIMLHDVSEDERMTLAISGYRYLSDNYGNVFGDSGGFGTASRITWLPYYVQNEALFHLGADYSYNDPARNLVQFAFQNEIFVGQNPELGPGGLDFLPLVSVPAFVQTGAIPTDDTNLFNLEAAAQYGSLVVQSEMRWAVVDQLNGFRNTFPGFYAHARYVLTGEMVEYDTKSGTFGTVVPDHPVRWGQCGIGAWEVAGRVSYIDLNGEGLPGPGRELTDLTAGLNWYVNRYTKFQFNYIRSFLDDPTLGESDAHTYAMRTQLEF